MDSHSVPFHLPDIALRTSRSSASLRVRWAALCFTDGFSRLVAQTEHSLTYWADGSKDIAPEFDGLGIIKVVQMVDRS